MLNKSISGSRLENSVLEKVGELQQDFLLLHETLTTGINEYWNGEGYSCHATMEKELYEAAVRILDVLRSGETKQ